MSYDVMEYLQHKQLRVSDSDNLFTYVFHTQCSVAGPKWERERAFEFEANLPPALYADDYEQAFHKAKSMTNEEIDAKRIELADWYIDRMEYIIRRVALTMEVFDAKRYDAPSV
jgi:hypothetical protein